MQSIFLILFALVVSGVSAFNATPFVKRPFLSPPTTTHISSNCRANNSSALFACRTNAKKEKRDRNRDNMRKFKTKGSSRRKSMKKLASVAARQTEMDFVAKIFKTITGGEDDKPSSGKR